MGRPKTHQAKIQEIVAVEVRRLHRKALGATADKVKDGDELPEGELLTTADLERLEVLARINKIAQLVLPPRDPNKPPDPAAGKAALAELERRMREKDIQPDGE